MTLWQSLDVKAKNLRLSALANTEYQDVNLQFSELVRAVGMALRVKDDTDKGLHHCHHDLPFIMFAFQIGHESWEKFDERINDEDLG